MEPSILTAKENVDEQIDTAAASEEYAHGREEEGDEVVNHLGRGGYLLRHGCGLLTENVMCSCGLVKSVRSIKD